MECLIFSRGYEMNLGLVMGFIGCAIALFIGISIFSNVSDSISCETILDNSFQEKCEETKDIAWTVIGILPIVLFFVLFSMFGGLGRGVSTESTEEEDENRISFVQVVSYKFYIAFITMLLFIGLAKKEQGK